MTDSSIFDDMDKPRKKYCTDGNLNLSKNQYFIPVSFLYFGNQLPVHYSNWIRKLILINCIKTIYHYHHTHIWRLYCYTKQEQFSEQTPVMYLDNWASGIR